MYKNQAIYLAKIVFTLSITQPVRYRNLTLLVTVANGCDKIFIDIQVFPLNIPE